MTVTLVTNGKKVEKKPPKKPFILTKKHNLKITGPNNEKLLLQPDGYIRRMFSPFGSMVSSPMLRDEIYEMLTGDVGGKAPTPENWLVKTPSSENLPPVDFVRALGQQLLEYSDEALCVYGVDRKDPKKWLGVVPKQKVTGGSVDVDDFGHAISTLSTKGYRTIGTLHTHPGGMTSCSAIDTGQLWNKFPGLHLIITHTGILSYHFSTRGVTWSLNDCEGFQHVELWGKKIPKPLKTTELLLGEDGTENYRALIKRQTYGFGKTKGKVRGLPYYKNTFDYNEYYNDDIEDLDKTDCYWGRWDGKDFKYVFDKQKNGQRVTVNYVMELGGYWDKDKRCYYAGKPVGYDSMVKSLKDRYTITSPNTDLILPSEYEKKKKEKVSKYCLTSIVDWMEEQKDPPLTDMTYNLELDSHLTAIGFAFENLEQFIVESISQELNPSKNMKSSIIRVLMLLPKLEQFIWGSKAKSWKEYGQMIPHEWKGKGV